MVKRFLFLLGFAFLSTPAIAAQHPFLIVSTNSYVAMRSSATAHPWSDIKAQAIIDTTSGISANYNSFSLTITAEGLQNRMNSMMDIFGAASLLYILDPASSATYKATMIDLLDKFPRLANEQITLNPTAYQRASPLNGTFVSMAIAFDVMYNDLTPTQQSSYTLMMDKYIAADRLYASSWTMARKGAHVTWEVFRGTSPIQVIEDTVTYHYSFFPLDHDATEAACIGCRTYAQLTDAYRAHPERSGEATNAMFNSEGGGPEGSLYTWARIAGGGKEKMAKWGPKFVLDYTGKDPIISNPMAKKLVEWMYAGGRNPFNYHVVVGDTNNEYPAWDASYWYNNRFTLTNLDMNAGLFSAKAAAWAARFVAAAPGTVYYPSDILSYVTATGPFVQSQPSVSYVLPLTGAAFWDEDQTTDALFAILWNPHSTGEDHLHPDLGTIYMTAYGEVMLSNVGYQGSGVTVGGFPYNYIHNDTRGGNVVMIGNSQFPARADTWSGPPSLAGYGGEGISDSLLSNHFDYASALTTSPYCNLNATTGALVSQLGSLERNVLFVHPFDGQNGYFVVADEVNTSTLGTVNMLWHPYSATLGTTTLNQEYFWPITGQKTSTTTLNVFLATPPNSIAISSSVFAGATVPITGTYINVQYNVDTSSNVRAVTVLYPSDSTHSKSTFTRVQNGAQVTSGPYDDFIIPSSGTVLTSTGTTFTGKLAFIRKRGGTMTQYFVRKGTAFTDGAGTGFTSLAPVSLHMLASSGTITSTGTTVSFYKPNVAGVWIDGVLVSSASSGRTSYTVAIASGSHAVALSTATAAANILWSDGWELAAGTTCNNTGDVTDNIMDAGAWNAYGPSITCTSTPPFATLSTSEHNTGSRSLQVHFKTGDGAQGPDFRMNKYLGSDRTDIYFREYVKWDSNWKWATADHKTIILGEGSGLSQDLYINVRGQAGDGSVGRLAIIANTDDSVFSDTTNGLIYPGQWNLVEVHIQTGVHGSVDAKLNGTLLTLTKEAGPGSSDPHDINNGASVGYFKIDTTYNDFPFFESNVSGGSSNVYYDDIAVCDSWCGPVGGVSVSSASHLTGFWGTDGGYKLAQEDLYPSGYSTMTLTRTWDGSTLKPFGAKNETVGFGLYLLNASTADASGVNVAISSFTGPPGYGISSVAVSSANVMDFSGRPIEQFYVRYLRLDGLTQNYWDPSEFEERSVPPRMRRPFTVGGSGQGTPSGLWTDRPDHDKLYPDIMVPYEAVKPSSFTVYSSSSQAVWWDVFVSSLQAPGTYYATITVTEGSSVSARIPVQLLVYNFKLPDQPSYNAITFFNGYDINWRHQNQHFPSPSITVQRTRDRYAQFLHRHRIGSIGDNLSNCCSSCGLNKPCPEYQQRLSGVLYTATSGYYNAPGVGTGDPIYAIGAYQSWPSASWSSTTVTNGSTGFCDKVGAYRTWFNTNSPQTKSFLYLADEPSDFTAANTWSTWMSTVTQCLATSYTINSAVTVSLASASVSIPHLNLPISTNFMQTSQANYEALNTQYQTTGTTQAWRYNGSPPGSAAAYALEEDGIGPLTIAMADFKKNIPTHFYWESTYWTDSNNAGRDNNVWNSALTFGYATSSSTTKGLTGFGYSNLDGLLMYPGTDVIYPTNSYGWDGPIASWRLKMIRKGINYSEYATLAEGLQPSTVTAIVANLMPKAYWENPCFDAADCSYGYGDRSWSSDPNVWETAREQLATIAASTATSVVTISSSAANGWQLNVNGSPYLVKGVSYAADRVGEDPNVGTLQDSLVSDNNGNGRADGPYDAWVDTNKNNVKDAGENAYGDFALMRDMNVNTIRLYHHSSDSATLTACYPSGTNPEGALFLNHAFPTSTMRDLYFTYGIRVALGDELGAYTNGSCAPWVPGTDYTDPVQIASMTASVREMVLAYKDEPWLLMYVLGNENNYDFTHTNAYLNPTAYYSFVGTIVNLIHSLDPNHPVALANGETFFISTAAALAPNLDIFGLNAYRNPGTLTGFGSMWDDIKALWDKPVLVTEFGLTNPQFSAGAFDDAYQAIILKDYWCDIRNHSAGYSGAKNAIGGFNYNWLDSWWQNGVPGSSATVTTGNNEMTGIWSQGSGTNSPYERQERGAYDMYTAAFAQGSTSCDAVIPSGSNRKAFLRGPVKLGGSGGLK